MFDAYAAKARWRDTWRVIGAKSNGDQIFADLVDRYQETHRVYHTLDHIADCLRHLDSGRELIVRPVEVEIALWFHDAIYDTQRNDSEALSAELAVSTLNEVGVDAAVTGRVAALINSTTHSYIRLAGDAAVICDVDLAILGTGKEEFERYDTAIRQEYSWVPEPIFRRERGRVLASFLVRPRIYQTDFFRSLFEDQARVNLSRTIESYRSGMRS